MRTKLFFLFFAFFLFGTHALSAQTSQKSYYVVIGMFPKLDDAEKLTDEANLKGFSAQYAVHRAKKEYYVYLLQTSEQKKAKSFLDQIQKETVYKKAWIYKGKLGDDQ
jgi:cell division septation protein DedD